jgi:staphylococcal nuclease domain-containing protein 1
LIIGKEISFVSTHSLPPNEDTPRDFGYAEFNGLDLATELLKNGWVKCIDRKREPTERDLRRKDIETEAKNAGKGVWNPRESQVRNCSLSSYSVLNTKNSQTRHTPSSISCLKIRKNS